jgi:hypothetical protein
MDFVQIKIAQSDISFKYIRTRHEFRNFLRIH